MTEEESVEIAKIANKIIAKALGADESTEYMRPSPELLAQANDIPEGSSTQEIAERLANQVLEILSPDWKGPF